MALEIMELPRIGLGTNRLRKTKENLEFIQAAIESGVQLIDSAHSYTGGESEETIGAALSSEHSSCVVATKGGFGFREAGHGRPERLRSEIEQSLRRLRTERIGLYYLHRVDPVTPIEESLEAIKEYVDRGSVALVGISDVDVGQIERARRVLPIAAVQNHYSLWERSHEAVANHCTANGIAFVAYFPLRGTASERLREIAGRHRVTSEQVALAWLLRRSPMIVPIPGSLSIRHVRENLEAARIEISDAEFEQLRLSFGDLDEGPPDKARRESLGVEPSACEADRSETCDSLRRRSS